MTGRGPFLGEVNFYLIETRQYDCEHQARRILCWHVVMEKVRRILKKVVEVRTKCKLNWKSYWVKMIQYIKYMLEHASEYKNV